MRKEKKPLVKMTGIGVYKMSMITEIYLKNGEEFVFVGDNSIQACGVYVRVETKGGKYYFPASFFDRAEVFDDNDMSIVPILGSDVETTDYYSKIKNRQVWKLTNKE